MLRTAIFGGSFNPIHLGHIGLAQAVLRQQLADEVWLMVSPQNPLKAAADLLDEQVRLRLAQKAVAGVEGVKASDYEFALPRPSFTWQMLRRLRQDFPSRTFSLLIGADNWALFPHWARHEEIVRTTPLIIYPREGFSLTAAELPPTATLLRNAPLFPYSSTAVRQAMRRGEDLSAMVPQEIIDELKTLTR